MKLQKIKKVCVEEKTAVVETPADNGAEALNWVRQWVGTPNAYYAVEGLEVTPGIMAAAWDLTDKQKGEIEWREDTTAMWLRKLPSQIDEEAPRLGLMETCGYCFFRQGEESDLPVIGIQKKLLEPVLACEGRKQYMVCESDANEPWLICYANGELNAAIRASDDTAIWAVMGAVKEMARRGAVVLAKKMET